MFFNKRSQKERILPSFLNHAVNAVIKEAEGIVVKEEIKEVKTETTFLNEEESVENNYAVSAKETEKPKRNRTTNKAKAPVVEENNIPENITEENGTNEQ